MKQVSGVIFSVTEDCVDAFVAGVGGRTVTIRGDSVVCFRSGACPIQFSGANVQVSTAMAVEWLGSRWTTLDEFVSRLMDFSSIDENATVVFEQFSQASGHIERTRLLNYEDKRREQVAAFAWGGEAR